MKKQNADVQFTKRKKDHLRLSFDPYTEAKNLNELDQIRLIPNAIPDLNFSEVSLLQKTIGLNLQTPFLISSMTAGSRHGKDLNLHLALHAEKHGWIFGVGSQRRQLFDKSAYTEWEVLRKKAPNAIVFGNLGLAQVIESNPTKIQELVMSVQAQGLFVHTNALQECLQPEGTPNFKGSWVALEKLKKAIRVPIVIKEVGTGISGKTQKRLFDLGIDAVDVSGAGGTHWGRLEGLRSKPGSVQEVASKTFQNWGLSTVECLNQANDLGLNQELWASGGVRSGLDALKLITMGAKVIGFARPALEAANLDLKVQKPKAWMNKDGSQSHLDRWMSQIEFEFKVGMFCLGFAKLSELKQSKEKLWLKA